jgi:hypothetical protein
MLNPNAKSGNVLPPATDEMVKQFYIHDEVCKTVPCQGKKIMFLLTQKVRRFISRND